MIKIFISGILATAVMSVIALMAPFMGMPPMDFGDMLGTHNPLMPMPYAVGWLMHFVVGVMFSVIYNLIAKDRLSGSPAVKGILFAMAPFVMAQTVVMPMMGNGFWSNGHMGALLGSLLGHVVFGAVLGAASARSSSSGSNP
jgi:uncharacterized membrane protein YagU involved in acid resistance